MPLHVQFMNASRSPYTKSGRPTQPIKKGDPYLFWWTIGIFILLGLTTFSWFFSLYVFHHPEKPKNYQLLAKFKKIEPLTRFNERTSPRGKFYGAKEIYGRYFNWTDGELDTQNALFKRSYIQNYSESTPVYIKGRYVVYKVEELSPSDVFPSGLVVRGRDPEFPNVSVEFIFPADQLPKNRPGYGDQISVTTNDFFASVLHVSRLPEESLCFTVVPLNSSFRYFLGSEESFALKPPTLLNMAGSWPVTDESLGDGQRVAAAIEMKATPAVAPSLSQ